MGESTINQCRGRFGRSSGCGMDWLVVKGFAWILMDGIHSDILCYIERLAGPGQISL